MDKPVREFLLASFQRTRLPLSVWHAVPNNCYEPPHTHDAYEMMIVGTGSGWCSINGRHSPMVRGDVYFMRPGDVHEFRTDPGTGFFNVLFSAALFSGSEKDLLNHFLSLFESDRKRSFPPTVSGDAEELLVALASELKHPGLYCECEAKSLFLRLLVLFVRFAGRAEGPLPQGQGQGRDELKLSRILNYIENHIADKITLEQLGRISGNTPEYLGRLFRSLTGLPVTEYILRRRVEQARRELEHANDSITEIALRLGFYDSAYFARTFHRIAGVTPSQYRRLSARKNKDLSE